MDQIQKKLKQYKLLVLKIDIDNLKKSFIDIFSRVPVSVLISVSIFVLLFIQIAYKNLGNNVENLIDKSILTLTLSFFFSIAIYLFSESKGIANRTKWFYQIATLIFGGLYYSFFEENLFNMNSELVVYIILTLLGIIAFLFFASFILDFIKKKFSQDEFYIFSYILIIKTLMAIIAGVATMLLGFIALSAIFSLFDLKGVLNEGDIFGYWASFSLSLFAPIFFLTNLPKKKVNQDVNIVGNKFYSFLINYIGLPAITIYFLILYAYTIKVIIHFSEWPNGKVSWMVIAFSFFGYLIYFASYIFRLKFKTVQIFRKIFPSAVLPQTFMLFYAIFLRIRQYDITINRYLVVVFGLWLFGLSLYFIISKRKYLGTIFYSLFLVIIFISIGPWSVYVLPEQRQEFKLKKYLKEAQILKDSKIVPLEKYDDIPLSLSANIYGSIYYLCSYHGCKSLNDVFAKEISEIKAKHRENFEYNRKISIRKIQDGNYDKEYKRDKIKDIENRKYIEISNWEIIRALTEKIKVRQYVRKGENNALVPEYFTYELEYNQTNSFNLKVATYDYYLELINGNINNVFTGQLTEDEDVSYNEMYYAVLDPEKEKLLVYYGGIDKTLKDKDKFLVESFSLNKNFKEILKKHNPEIIKNGDGLSMIKTNDADDLSFDLTGKKIDVRLQLQKISIKNPKWKVSENKISDKSVNKDSFKNRIIEKLSRKGFVSGMVLIREKK